jgi:hypothetical protein
MDLTWCWPVIAQSPFVRLVGDNLKIVSVKVTKDSGVKSEFKLDSSPSVPLDLQALKGVRRSANPTSLEKCLKQLLDVKEIIVFPFITNMD